VHVEDISRAFLAVLEAPRDAIHNQAFNVGSSAENYQIRDIAEIVRDVVPNVSIRYAEGAGPDPRCYRVDCSKIVRHLPGFVTTWTVRRGAEELYSAFQRHGLTREQFSTFTRLTRIKQLMADGRLDESLYWRKSEAATV
jgi:nucleoside-diphosphate-sugar epimerase